MTDIIRYNNYNLVKLSDVKELMAVKTFTDRLIEYISYYWKQHQWTAKDMETIPPSKPVSYPVFHGMVIYSDTDMIDKNIFKQSLLRLLASHNMSMYGGINRNTEIIISNFGEFSFVNVDTYNKPLAVLLNGRTYDIIFIFQSKNLVVTDEMLSNIVACTKDHNPSRLFVIDLQKEEQVPH